MSPPPPAPDPARRGSSYLTIQSDSKGRFGDLVEAAESHPQYPSLLGSDFSCSDTDSYARQVHLALRLFLRHVRPEPLFRRKDCASAEAARLEGNALFQRREVNKARAAYSKSVICAPKVETELLSLSLANRSACSLHLGNFSHAIDDIHHALALNYPKEKRSKLYLRLAKCHLKLGQQERGRPALQIARSFLPQGEDGEENVPQEFRDVEAAMIRGEAEAKTKGTNTTQNERSTVDDPAFSSNLAVRHEASLGRFVVADKNIAAGEVLCSEPAYASALYPERAGSHCAACLARADAPVPCAGCAGVAFCSAACRDAAAESFHGVECRFADALTGFGCSQIARLAFRMVTKHKLSHFLHLRKRLHSPKEEEGSKEKGSDPYCQVFSLVSNNRCRWPEDNFRRALMAGVLLKILRAAGYFGEERRRAEEEEEGGAEPTSEEVFVGTLLLRNLQVLQFNAHEVYESLRGSKSSLKPWKSQPIALAVYPNCSYFNHSCHGSVARTFRGDTLVLTALRPIKKGEEVQENYGPTFYLKKRKDRRLDLSSRYWFDCGCRPCRENWPPLSSLPRDPALLSSSRLKRAQELMDGGRPEEAVKELAALANERKGGDSASPPSEEAIRVEDKMRTCLSNMGNLAFVEAKKKEA